MQSYSFPIGPDTLATTLKEFVFVPPDSTLTRLLPFFAYLRNRDLAVAEKTSPPPIGLRHPSRGTFPTTTTTTTTTTIKRRGNKGGSIIRALSFGRRRSSNPRNPSRLYSTRLDSAKGVESSKHRETIPFFLRLHALPHERATFVRHSRTLLSLLCLPSRPAGAVS